MQFDIDYNREIPYMDAKYKPDSIPAADTTVSFKETMFLYFLVQVL